MKENERNRAIVAEVIARSWRESAYLSQFRQNPKSVLEQAGAKISSKMDVVLLENTPTLINVVLPPPALTGKYEARMQAAAQLLKDLPEDMEVHLHRDSDSRAFIVLPEAPQAGGELSDRQLEHAVGGKGSSHKTAPPPPPPPIPAVAVVVGVNPAMTVMSGDGEAVSVIAIAGSNEQNMFIGAVLYC
jgi:hypothetical protein